MMNIPKQLKLIKNIIDKTDLNRHKSSINTNNLPSFTLIETLVALAIITTTTLALVGFLQQSSHIQSLVSQRIELLELGYERFWLEDKYKNINFETELGDEEKLVFEKVDHPLAVEQISVKELRVTKNGATVSLMYYDSE